MKGTESDTRMQLRDKIASLSQSELGHATDALAMIWDGVVGPLDLPQEPKSTFSLKFTPPPNWHRVQLALLKLVPTGTFVDVQFYAYNAVHNGVLQDLRLLFTSSIVIEEWAAPLRHVSCDTSLSSNPDMRQRDGGVGFSSRMSDGWINQ